MKDLLRLAGGMWVAFAIAGVPSTSGFAAEALRHGPLKPFHTDGCTHFAHGTLLHPERWLHCCVRHDLSYWAGGDRRDRQEADLQLRDCVEKTGHPDVADIMFVGVRVGGRSHWGGGWTIPRGYQPLTDEERREVWEKTPDSLKPYRGF